MEYLKEYKLATDLITGIGKSLKKKKEKKIESSILKDIKLFLDRETEKLIIEGLETFSDFNILSEEQGFVKDNKKTEECWIVDPIDGSMNFLRGFKFYSISLALWKKNEPIFGIIYNFETEDLYSGFVGLGATHNKKRIKNSLKKSTNESILATGFPVYLNLDDDYFVEFKNLVRNYKKIRMIGSASLSIAMVAVGVFDSYYEKNIKLWDVAAGLAIIKSLNMKIKKFEIKKNNLVDIHI
jgi:myo-inositol-1(or 4)-monophosphatase